MNIIIEHISNQSGIRMDEQLKKPDIFDFTNYRIYLESAYKYHKSNNKKFSYRFIAQYTGASSPGWFPNITRGRINLTSSYGVKIQKLLKLDPRECEYFEALVGYNQAGSHEEKLSCFEKMSFIRGIVPALLRQEHLAYLTKWYISAIRELLLIYPFKGNDFQHLARMITPSLQNDEAREAVEVLKNLGMVRLDSKGFIKPCDSVIMKDPSVKTDLWKTYMKSKMDLGLKAIDSFSKEERDISEVYMPFSREGFELARSELAKLRKKLLVISEKDKSANRVYQCTLQLFPLSKNVDE